MKLQKFFAITTLLCAVFLVTTGARDHMLSIELLGACLGFFGGMITYKAFADVPRR